ncbi:Zn-finger-containing protein [Trachipleistophora hominis]|uniref:Zn-finger-containing protein n=1 Tax=Trachipleistophora hominis TaxID=72359 RepID=L7JWF9_TRAHO|nr:Zn-finger-containing protein [Trachipleistophora hominis]
MKRNNILNLNHFFCYDQNNEAITRESLELNSFNDILDIEEYYLNKKTNDTCDYGVYYDFIPEKQLNKIETAAKEMYRPKHVKGKGILREGYCDSCNKWFRLKTSSYWYHMNYKHGINSKGKKYPQPYLREMYNRLESYCRMCDKWIFLCSASGKKSVTYAWYRHFQKNHSD